MISCDVSVQGNVPAKSEREVNPYKSSRDNAILKRGRATVARSMPPGGNGPSSVPELHVLVRRERAHLDPGDGVLRDPRPDAHQGAEIHDRREHRAVDRELLDLVQQRLAFLRIPLVRLLQEEI